MPVLVDAEFGACLVAIDVAGVGAELWEAGADCAADGEIPKQWRHGRPQAHALRICSVPSIREGARVAAICDHDSHGQTAWSCGVMQRPRGDNRFRGGEELVVLGKGKAAHEHRAGKDLLVCWFCHELAEQVHRVCFTS